MKPNDLDVLLEVLQADDYKQLLNALPLNQFFSVQNWPTVQGNLNSYMVIMLYRSILLHSAISVDTTKSFTMQIGKLHHLLSSTLLVGYVIELPKKVKLVVGSSIVSATVGKLIQPPATLQDVPVAEHDFINKHLSIYMQNTSQLITCKTDKINFIA